MNLANPETKVGLFTITAILAMFFVFIWLSGIQLFDRGTDIEVIFDRIEGLRPGTAVKFIGVDVGRISKIYFDGMQVVVVMRIQPQFKIPHPAKVTISSSGVVGDKFLEIIPAKPGEVVSKGKRLIGQEPVTMEQFYATAFDVLDSLRTVANSVKNLIADPEVTSSLKNTLHRMDQITADIQKLTSQLQGVDITEIFKRIDNITLSLQRMTQTNEPQINELVANITKVSTQLAEASITANRFLGQVDNNGQTATDLKAAIASARSVTANLDKFTTMLASNDKNIDQLIDDAHQTMQAIKQAADNINKAVDQLTTGEGSLSQVKETISLTRQAAAKVNNYVSVFEHIQNSLGANYQKDYGLTVDYGMDLGLNDKNSLLLGLKDIGQQNLTTLQWDFKSNYLDSRVGLYKSKFGVGCDLLPSKNLSFGINLWDTHSPNLGLSTDWKFTPDWAMSLGAESNLETRANTWNFEWWRNF